MAKLFYAILLGFHLSVTVLHHIGSAVMVCNVMPGVLPVLQDIKAMAPTRYYAHYTGTGVGSGYFAPRVGSSFHVYATFVDADGHIQQVTSVPWVTRAAQLRYTAFCQLFQEFTNRDDPTHHAYEKAVARHISMRMAQSRRTAKSEKIVTSVAVYRLPTLAEYKEGTPAVLREVFRDTTTIDQLFRLP